LCEHFLYDARNIWLAVQSCGASPDIWDHTVLPVTQQVNAPLLNSSQKGRYSIYLPWRDGRLSWPRWLVTYRDGLLANRQSSIQVLTWLSVEQLC